MRKFLFTLIFAIIGIWLGSIQFFYIDSNILSISYEGVIMFINCFIVVGGVSMIGIIIDMNREKELGGKK